MNEEDKKTSPTEDTAETKDENKDRQNPPQAEERQETPVDTPYDPAPTIIGNSTERAKENEGSTHTTATEPEQPWGVPVTAPQEASGGFWSALFNGFARGGPIILLIAMFCMAWHDFYKPGNAVYCPPEFRSITAFLHCVAQNSWLTPAGLDNGAWTAWQWPGFLWFTGLFALIPGLAQSSLLLPVVEFCAAALAVIAIWWLAHTCKFGLRSAFAAGMMALCCPLFAPLPHFMGPGVLAAALLLFALLFFYKGWTKDFSLFSLPIAFILTALAGLTGGPLHLFTPLLASVCFLIWRGGVKRAQRIDALFGFLLMLVIIGVWLGFVMLKGQNGAYLAGLFNTAIISAWPLPRGWWMALAAGFLGTLPWILSIFGVSWVRVVAKAGEAAHASRHDNGSALIWCALVIASILAVWTPHFHPAAVVICTLVLILLGKAFVRMPAAGNRFFFFLAALAALCVGLLICALHFEQSQSFLLTHLNLPLPEIAQKALLENTAVLSIAAILALGGIGAFWFAKRYQHGGGLVYALLIAVILCQPGRLWLVPELASDPNLPIRHYDAILAEVDKALSQPAGNVPDTATEPPSGVTPKQSLPAGEQPTDAGPNPDSVLILEQPQPRGSTVPPANNQPGTAIPETQPPAEVIIEEIAPPQPENGAQKSPTPENPNPELTPPASQENPTQPNALPAAPAEENNSNPSPAEPEQDNVSAPAIPEAAQRMPGNSIPEAEAGNARIEEIIVETLPEKAPARPVPPVTGERTD